MHHLTEKEMKASLITILLILTLQAFAQVKVEREYRTDRSEVPPAATRWLDSTFRANPKKVKWYREETGNERNFEAKFRWQGKNLSVEFAETGEIDDVEITIGWNNIPEPTRMAIHKNLTAQFLSHRILKVQLQLVGSPHELFKYFNGVPDAEIILNYELELKGRTHAQNEIWEILFNSNGDALLTRRVILNPASNLDY